jgi:hypothetical protein
MLHYSDHTDCLTQDTFKTSCDNYSITIGEQLRPREKIPLIYRYNILENISEFEFA